jgi:Ca2+-binding EF-hand superfamily protein
MSRGPQGDMIRVENYVRLVRGGEVSIATGELLEVKSEYNNPISLQSSSSLSNSISKNTEKSLNSSNKFINRFDKNNDDKVELSEFKAGEQRFKHFDKNNDGFISADEAPTGPPKGDH